VSFDAYLYQTIEKKQNFIGQIMSSKSPVRSCEDVDESALSYAEIKALCAGDERIREKMDLDIEVSRLRLLKSDYQNEHYRLEDNLIKRYPESIQKTKERIAGYENDAETLKRNTPPNPDAFAPMTIAGVRYTERTEAAAALLIFCKNAGHPDSARIGEYKGFEMHLSYDTFYSKLCITLKGKMSYMTPITKNAAENLARVDAALAEVESLLNLSREKLTDLHRQIGNAKTELEKPFPQETALAEKSARLAILDAELNLDNGEDDMEQEREREAVPETERERTDVYAETEKISAKSAAAPAGEKPSIMEALRTGVYKGVSLRPGDNGQHGRNEKEVQPTM
jgi:hypothetical protein